MLLRLRGRVRAEIGIFFIAEAGAGPGLQFCLLPGPGSFFFHFRGRGWAGIKNFEMTGAEPGFEKLGNVEAGPGLEVI